MMGRKPTVLIVEDEPDVRDLYSTYVEDRYAVRTAASGREALEAIDESIDVVLLDRRMPDMSGDEVLSAIRERGYPCRVAMVTAVDAGFDIVDMDFDAYVTKPVSPEELVSCIESLLQRIEYDDLMQEYYAVASKIAALEEEKSDEELAKSDEAQELRERLEELRERTRTTVEGALDNDDMAGLLQEV